ncbi:obscurin isoform X5 [Eucyclogobius newberryi]|uniref:obscurin isoform X5 n=1 Tax=Eucyclogobius newberryi TaxID=166745 RepID=UPI003B59FB3D
MDVFGGAPRFLAYPRPVMVQSGTDAVLKCQIGGDPRPAVIWERNNEKIDPQERYRVFEDGNVYNLIIPSVTVEDSGQYICKAKNSIGETYAAATLKVEGEAQEMELREENKPRFLIKPLSTRAGRGEDAVFSCKVWGKPKPDVIWEKDGKKLNDIFESTHFSVGSQDGGWFQLKIFKTRAPDGGVYTCKARNEFGEALAGAVLLVDAGPGHDDEANRNGYTNGQWKSAPGRNGRPAPNRLNNDAMTKTAKVKMFAVTEGKHAKFRCFVTGKPKPEIIWRKDGRLILSGRRYLLYEDREGYFTLKVLYCKQKDNGVYVCAASNTAGQTLSAVHLSVKEPPVRFKQPLIDLEVWERDLAVLECEVPEDSVPITWYLEDRRLQPGDKYGMEQWGTKRRLTIRDIGVDDDGIYLCEMPDGGRSIAEVAVKGTIVRKLPRKVDVLEGENAAFCVEVEEEEMDIHWYKDGVELRETHQTILKSFGRTHILVFVNTMPPDTGQVMFFVGRSKTSSQLRVKAARHCPPSAPVGVQINTERANAALLSWIPAQDSRKNPPSGYVLERQEVGTGSQEWLQCLTTDSATSVEILGDSVPCEADYRFRICSVNKYGKSNNVEFPRTVHLVPVARIQVPLQDAMVPEGQDALFSMELTASVIGTWFLSGTQIQEDERFSTRRTRTHQSLRIRGVRDSDNGAEITFIAYGIRDSAALYIQAPLVKFLPLSEMDRNKFVETGIPIVLYCELSDPAAPVHWYKNGAELQTTDGLHIQSEGTMRRIVIQSAEFSHSGVYCCDAIDDVIRFNVEVEAPPVRFSAVPEAERNKRVHCGRPLLLQCEVSEPSAPVTWHKDGSKLAPQSGLEVLSEARVRSLLVHSAELYHTGLYSCKSKGDAATFNVDVTAPAVVFEPVAEEGRALSVSVGHALELQCSVSDPEALVRWFHDDTELGPHSGFQIRAEGGGRTLCVQSAEMCHSGVYTCSTGDDSVEFTVDVQAIPALTVFERMRSLEAVTPLELECEVPDSALSICWFKDDEQQLLPKQNQIWDEQENRERQIMVVQSSESLHSALNRHETKDDTVHVTVHHEAPVRLTAVGDTHRSCDAGEDVDLICEVSNPKEPVSWFRDGARVCDGAALKILSHHSNRQLSIASAAPGQSGVYSCHTADHSVQFHVDVKAPLLRFSALPEAEQRMSVLQGCPLALRCELSDASGQVTWYKDGAELLPESGVDIQSEGQRRSVFVPSAERQHCGVYRCESKDDDVQFTVDIRDSAVKAVMFLELPDTDRKQQVLEGSPVVLQCELSQVSSAEITWSKDGEKVHPDTNTNIHQEGLVHTLKIHSAERQHSGVYECSTNQDKIQFEVDVKGRAAHILPLALSDKHKLACVGAPIVLQCQVSEAAAQVTWAKDHMELFCRTGLDMKRDGCLRKLMVHCAKLCDAGTYSCSLAHDVVTFSVRVQAVPEADSDTVVPGRTEPSDRSRPPDTCHFTCPKSHQPLPEPRRQSGPTQEMAPPGVSEPVTPVSKDGLVSLVQAPPVTFREIPEEDLLRTAVEQEELVLSCEVSAPEGAVQWYKDGAEVQPSDALDVRAEGTARSLTVRSARLSDTGTFSCRTGDNVVMFKVTVREPPVTIVYPKEDVHLDRHVPEEVILSCELSRANGVVSWFKDGQKLQESENIKLKVEGPYRRLKILSSRVEDSGEYVCDSDHDSIFFQLSITEPPVRIVSPSQSQMELCQQTSERMVLSCEISRPNAVVRWYRDGLQVEESQNLLIEEDGVYRRLIIPKTTIQDSAEYVCDTADDSMTFFVNIAEPPVRFVRPRKSASKVETEVGKAVVLDCEVSRPNAEVTWKRNGDEVEDMKNVSILEEGVLRQLTIHALAEEDAGQYVCDAKDDLMDFTVTVKEPPVRIVGKPEGRTEKAFCVADDIILVCEMSRANADVTWSKDGRPLEESERYCTEEQGVFRSLVVLNAALEDSGEYGCSAGDDSMVFHITVREPPVQIVGNSGTPEHHLLLRGEDLVLECEVSRPDAEVRWLRNGEELGPDERVTIQSCHVVRKFVLMNLQPSDSGEFTCDAADDRMVTVVEVQEPPVSFTNKPSQPTSLAAFEGESVTLSAELTRELDRGQAVRWLKDGRLLDAENIHISSSGAEQRLTLSPLQMSDSGVYACDAMTDQMTFNLLVREMKVQFVRPLQSAVALRGHSLTLLCEVNKAKGDVQWLKDGLEVAPSRRFTVRALGRERSFTVHEVSDEDAGEFSCASTDDRTTATVTVQAPRVVEFIAGLRNVTLREGEDAVFKCVVSPEDVALVWQINGRAPSSQRATATRNGTCHTLRLCQCGVCDSGTVSANAEGQVSSAELQVQEPQVVFTRHMSAVTAEELGEALLEVEVSQDSGEVQWMRQGVLLHAGPKYSLLKQGHAHSLRVHQLHLSDSGRFSCETLHDRTQAQLTVTPRKISITKGLSDLRTTERETASFEVHVSHPDLVGTWFRNGTRLKPNAHFRMSSTHMVHSLTISHLSVDDTGSFMFCVDQLKTTARLVVREPPVSVLKKLEDQKFPEGAVISIECELSRHNVDIKWMKNGVEVKPSKELRIYAMGRKRFLQVLKCRLSDSGVYTCDAGDASTSCSVEVYEPELLVVQELEDLEIEEDQNAIFMCEVSVEEVQGEWYKKNQKIQNTSSIKTRQEGSKHFLLMCNVRPEDSGEIKFVARHVQSVAFLDVEELPVSIVKPLQDTTAMEKTRVLLDCTVSNPRCSCRWYRGCSVILPSERFEICSEGCTRKLIIQQVALEDEGTYSVQVGEHSCSARLSVEAQSVSLVRGLSDLQVVAPDDARFEVEVSVPLQMSPVWTLKGVALRPGPGVLMEKMGTLHRLTLRQTTAETSGDVEFVSGKTRSRARLAVVDPE